ncbi:MAG TPA: aldehyde dehydrogenase family protein [Candidatus Limnocylindria bacterium]|nr:aldehyde dehydrogenase family protein [Candidatus Limnocylindria bacterium]
MTELLRSYVDGAWRDGVRTAARTDPAHPSTVVAEVSLADSALATAAVLAARKAFASWRATPAPARGEILRRAADLMEHQAENIGRDLTREEGKTIGEAIGETRRAVAILRYYAGQTLEPDGDTYPSATRDFLLYTKREPLGVVVAITPWNFPIAIPAWKVAPALAFGNAVVWKPAELVPLTAVHFVQALIDAGLPAGVLNLVLGSGADVGNVLVTHPDVDAITFTGSNAVGHAIQGAAIAAGKRVQLEMGGKNPAVVLADADLDHAAEQIARGAFLSAGQKCTATSRVIVERSATAGLVERLAERARSWKLGDPLAPETIVGPLVSDERLRKVLGYLDVAKADGGRLVAGGGRADGEGHFVRPTVFTDVPARSRASREEIFGPVALVVPAASGAEALAIANDTPFGLVASVFTRDLGAALAFARELRAGVVKINQETAGLELQLPFGGVKDSSSGSREQGKAAREFFTEWKTIYMGPPG